jgi:hypothetical protein
MKILERRYIERRKDRDIKVLNEPRKTQTKAIISL